MAWKIEGTYLGPCSCKVSCPCELGELEADRGWCSGILAFDVRSGSVDGVDVGGTRTVLIGDWPSGFLAGNGKGVLYFDDTTSAEQVAALESVYWGKKGGVFDVLGGLVVEWLPSQKAPISFSYKDGDGEVSVGDVGTGTFSQLRGATGEPTRVLHGAAAFRDEVFLGKGTGSRFHPPGMRDWESGGHSERAEFDWSA